MRDFDRLPQTLQEAKIKNATLTEARTAGKAALIGALGDDVHQLPTEEARNMSAIANAQTIEVKEQLGSNSGSVQTH